MKTFNAIVFFLSFLSISLSQETHIESNDQQQNVASSINLEDPDSESVREQRSFLKKKLCKVGGLGGGLFGNCKGHQGSYSYGHYHEPSGYGHNTNDHSYGGNYGGSNGYGGSHGYNNYDHGGGYYNSKPSYGSGYGYTKPGLTYSIGGYSKSPSYGSYGGYGKSTSYGGGYHSGYNSYNSDYSNGGYGKLSSYTGHGYSSGGYNSDEHPYNYMKYGSYSSDDYSSHNNYGTKSYNTDKYGHHKNHGKTYGKNTKSETSHESSSSEEDDGKFTNKGGHKKDHHNKDGSIIPLPFLPVVNQPVIYVPPVPSISVVQPVVHRDYNSLYAPSGPCGSSHYSADYSGSICGNPTYYAPLAPSIHHHGGTHQYSSGPSVYQTVTPTHASSAAIVPASYSASAIAYPAPLATYYSTPASTYPTAIAPVAVNYGNAAPTYQNSGYSYPAHASYPAAGPTSGTYVSPTYTVTSFDVQTITSPYQHVIPNEVKTFAKSGSSMAKANAPGGYVASAKASSSSDSSRSNPDSLRSNSDSSRLNRDNDGEDISSKEEKDKRQAESDYKQQEDYYYLT